MANGHALLSPSSAHRWMACPASVYAEKDLPDNGNAYSNEGTAGHELARICLTQGGNTDVHVGEIFTLDNGALVEITAGLAEVVQTYLDKVRNRVAAYTLAGGIAQQEIEVSIPLTGITGELGATGTTDALLTAHIYTDLGYMNSKTVIDVIDLKLGRGVEVEPEWNPQALMYAAGAIENLEMLSPLNDSDEVNLIIHQPRLDRKFKEWRTTAGAVNNWVETVARPAADRALLILERGAKPEDFNPGEKQCRFCKAKATCEALAREVQRVMESDFDELNADTVDEVVEFDNNRLGWIYPKLALIELWVASVQTRVKTELFSGRVVPGTKLVKGRLGRREWSSVDEAEKIMKTTLRLKVDEMYDKHLISPTVAEKLLAKEQPAKWKKIEPYIIQPEGAPSVALDSDKRPAVMVSPLEDDL